MNKWITQEVISGLALIVMGVLSGLLVFVPVPTQNTELITFALGAISGALTVSGGSKTATALATNSQTKTTPQTPPTDASASA